MVGASKKYAAADLYFSFSSSADILRPHFLPYRSSLSLYIYIYLSVAYIYTIYAEEAEKDAPVIGPLPPKTISMEKKE